MRKYLSLIIVACCLIYASVLAFKSNRQLENQSFIRQELIKIEQANLQVQQKVESLIYGADINVTQTNRAEKLMEEPIPITVMSSQGSPNEEKLEKNDEQKFHQVQLTPNTQSELQGKVGDLGTLQLEAATNQPLLSSTVATNQAMLQVIYEDTKLNGKRIDLLQEKMKNGVSSLGFIINSVLSFILVIFAGISLYFTWIISVRDKIKLEKNDQSDVIE